MKHQINNNIKELLYKAGWNENRKLDEFKLKESVTKNGYEVLTSAMDFLMKFDGLVIRFPNLKNGIEDDITLDFNKAAELESTDLILGDYQLRIGKRLCVIGTAYRDHFILIMDEDGKVYGGYDHFLVRIANTGVGAIESIINNEKFIEIE